MEPSTLARTGRKLLQGSTRAHLLHLPISPHLRSMYIMPFTQVLRLWTGHASWTEMSASSGAGRNVCIPAFDVQHAFYSSAPILDLMGAADRSVCIPGSGQKCLHPAEIWQLAPWVMKSLCPG